MRNYLGNVLVVQTVYFLILGKGIVEDVHDDARVIHHAEGVQGGGDASLVPPVEDHLDAAQPTLHDTDQGRVLLKGLVDDLYVALVGSERL